MKVRSHIALLVFVILVPAVLFSTAVLSVLLDAEHKAALRSMQELARASVSIMDREMTYAMATAHVLSTSSNLHEGNFHAFYNQAKKANVDRVFQGALIAENGQQVFNTVRPYGTQIPAPNGAARDRIARVLERSTPGFSDLIKGSATGKYVVSVEYPVTIRDGRRFVVNEWIFSDYLKSLLPKQDVPATWLIAVFDQKASTIARNIRHDDFVGKPPTPERERTILAGFRGISRAYTRDGVEMYGAWERSSITGWTVGVGVPVSEIENVAARSVALTAFGFVIATMLGIAGAYMLSRRLLAAINQVAASAEMLSSHKVPPIVDLRVDEMTRLQKSLHEAGHVLVEGEAVRQRILHEATLAKENAQQAQQIAEEQNRAKDDFLAMLGHELRNPLAAISSGITLLNMPTSDIERIAKVKGILQRQTQHLTNLVEELLDAHRILNGKIRLSPVPLDIKDAVESCLASFETRGAFRTHTVTSDLSSVMIEADPTRLEQMICNLIDNALKYTPEGGTVKVSILAENGHATLTVADSGIGLEPELLKKAFDVFVQGKVVNRTKGGLGIGLAVVNSLARQHGATLSADSPGPSKGSAFTLRFPVTALGLVPAKQHEPNSAVGIRVLVIEDNRDVREMMTLMLSELGFVVHAASDGKSGIESASTFLPKVALVDIDLPDMSGYDVAAALRGNDTTAGIVLVAVTGYGQATDQQNAYSAGFDRHFAKPVSIDDLVSAINSLT